MPAEGARGGAGVELSVVIPTRNRRDVLEGTLSALASEAQGEPIEVIVVNDGSEDGTAWTLSELSVRLPLALRVIDRPARGPAAARNQGIGAARGAACLFLGDDVRPRPGLLARHLEFHREHPRHEEALLGLVVPEPPLDRSPFIRWLHREGAQFGYARLDAAHPAPPECFWTANVSAKAALLREVGGFDEGFGAAACEDAELGVRLARAGMRLRYDPEAVGEHCHPTDLKRTLERMAVVGRSYRLLAERAPELPVPRPPSLRHRVKAAALTALDLLPGRPDRLRAASWRFLCDEVQREAMYSDGEADGPGPRIGAALARRALRDPNASGIVGARGGRE
jgi:glycosyltransferase involved in cell wall biosynthesis